MFDTTHAMSQITSGIMSNYAIVSIFYLPRKKFDYYLLTMTNRFIGLNNRLLFLDVTFFESTKIIKKNYIQFFYLIAMNYKYEISTRI